MVARPKQAPAADSGFEVVDDDEPVIAKPKKKPRPKIVDDDDEEEDDYNDRPRKKKNKQRGRSGSPAWMYAAIAGVLLLIVGGVGIYFLASSKGGLFGPSWTKFDAPDGTFTAYFPGGPPANEDVSNLISKGEKNDTELTKEKQEMEKMGIKFEAWSRTESRRKYVVGVMVFPPFLVQLMKSEFEKSGAVAKIFGNSGSGNILSETNVTVSGYSGKQILTKDGDNKRTFGRVILGDGRIFLVYTEGDSKLTADDSITKAFLEKFEIKKK
ncbi:MAG TPA: hypothetical protein VGJ05_11055 [Fimbriiglobus sp.]